MTYNVFGGTLNLALSIYLLGLYLPKRSTNPLRGKRTSARKQQKNLTNSFNEAWSSGKIFELGVSTCPISSRLSYAADFVDFIRI